MNPHHRLVREHIRAGGRAVVLEEGINGQQIMLYDKGAHIPLLWTHLIPATLEGRALHNVQNAMFAAAMAYSMGVKLENIRHGLRTFDTTFFQAPGRMNVFDEHPFKVILDYGHNPAAVRAMCHLVERHRARAAGASWCSPRPATAATRTSPRSPPIAAGPLRPLHLPPRRQPARPQARRGAEAAGAGAARRTACRPSNIQTIAEERAPSTRAGMRPSPATWC